MAIQSRKIFVDSSVFIGFIDRADGNHPKAVKVMENLARTGYQLFTSSLTVNEVYIVLTKETGHPIALDFLQTILQSDIEIIFPQKADFITANRILRSNREKQLILKEALNAILMQRRGISQIITFAYWHNILGSNLSTLSFA